ncbi:DUF2513 domain-containing protein [Xanthomarina gelatinilytica]|uniref:DUF2513 domain-containing protein n=1 Tax=Xanthomarina gelatinilytica TaxID=1137281 RepID=UPI003AA975EF
MKVDYEKIKEILIVFEENNKPTINTLGLFSTLNYDTNNQEDFDIVWHYLKLLREQDLIECLNDSENNLGISFTGSGQPIISVKNFRLTIIGHQTLETMKTNKAWEKVKDGLKTIGIHSLKNIPTLAIKMISEQ